MGIWPNKACKHTKDQPDRISVRGQSVKHSLLGLLTFIMPIFRSEEEDFPLSTLSDKHCRIFSVELKQRA